MGYRFVKGHGTENDFVLLPDPDGLVHGALAAERVRALCNRRAGIGGDGVLRVIRSAALAELLDIGAVRSEWFMDYRNADGSLSEMCGNGLRVFVRFLVAEGLVAEEVALAGFSVATRAGDKAVRLLPDGRITIDLGVGESRGETSVTVGEREIPAVDIRTGNPHAVAFVGALAEAGALAAAPGFDAARYPEGVNVEFVTWVGPRHVAMRVFERGVGETRS
ncbi:MAG: diaminopimelate epimerase, partial [Nocardioides sp.]